MAKRLSRINLLLETKLWKRANMRGHIAFLELEYSRILAMGSNIEASTWLGISIGSFIELNEYTPPILSINKMEEVAVL